MVRELEYVVNKFGLDLSQRSPFRIPELDRRAFCGLLAELGYKSGAEIGVAQGQHARWMCDANPSLQLYAIDVWEQYDGYHEYTDRTQDYYRRAQIALSPFSQVRFIKAFSMDAVKRFRDFSLDFVYIDAAHDFKHVAEDICEWSRKVRVGGIVAGHDYRHSYRKGYPIEVKHVVQAFCYVRGINPWFVMDKSYNESWFYVRQESDRVVV